MQRLNVGDGCSGCHACYSICSKSCITMDPDCNGFLYPVINLDLCVNCGMCEKVCQAKSDNCGDKGIAYACANKNEQIRSDSSSGGVFSILAEKILGLGGCVFGATFDNDFNVRHICVTQLDDLKKLRGSKYVQSTIGNCYTEAKQYLDDDRFVLFTGTPCQIDGLLNFLQKSYDKLFTQDIVCHGVSSPKVWSDYIQFRENKALAQTKRILFRNKKHGWKKYSVLFEFSNGSRYEEIHSDDLFMKGFLSNLLLRNSCYICNSKSLLRRSDITLADFWGIENILPDWDYDKGVSLVFVNSPKGKKFFESLTENMIYKEVDLIEAVKYNFSAEKSVSKPNNRERFMRDINASNFESITDKYTKKSLIWKALSKSKRIAKGVMGHVQK